MNLLELQRRMSRDVMRPLTPDFAMQPIPEQGLPFDEVHGEALKAHRYLNATQAPPTAIPPKRLEEVRA